MTKQDKLYLNMLTCFVDALKYAEIINNEEAREAMSFAQRFVDKEGR